MLVVKRARIEDQTLLVAMSQSFRIDNVEQQDRTN
jgi:hypothetical protein